jgi:hypothetical protein
MLGLPAWDVKNGYGSFLTFEFGDPKLVVKDRNLPGKAPRRAAYCHGEWHLWIYCCHWRVLQDGNELAWSEDSERAIGRATGFLNGQKLVSVSADPDQGRSTFVFDLGGSLETWPYGDDPTEEQWNIRRGAKVFAYRADGAYACGPDDTEPHLVRWLPLR